MLLPQHTYLKPSRLEYKMPRTVEMPEVDHFIPEMPMTPWKVLRVIRQREIARERAG
jgi:hypothetical protein